MRLDIEGQHMAIPPYLLSGMVERLKALNTPRDPTFRAQVTLRLAGRTFHVQGTGTRLDEAVTTALETVAQAVHSKRTPQVAVT